MINPIITLDVVHDEQPTRQINMGEMDAESIAFMLSQSRDGFYSNKELAPIREYSTNAMDSHVDAGIPDRPIEVTLPTQLEPELKIRDFGKGLPASELERVYFKYWKSTKRYTNEQNGFFGIGSKSAMAYSDGYAVISICDGRKMVYTAHKNGIAAEIFNKPNVDNEPSGIQVIIPVLQKDISKFITEALDFFKYWNVRPIFNNVDADKLKEAFNAMDTAPFLSGEGWAIRPSGYGKSQSKAIMSNIPYTIDWEQVRNSLPPEVNVQIGGIFDFLQENLTTLYFPNGTLSFTPNRESLQYNDVTLNAIISKLKVIYNSLLNLISSKIADAPNLWEAKIRYNQIFRREMEGFDKEALYSGNLTTIENLLRGRIQWKGITVENGMFEDLDSWDKNEGNTGGRYNRDREPIMVTYVKSEDKTGIVACKSGRRRRRYGMDSKIICSPNSVVVIQDTDKNASAKGLARWFLYKAKNPVSQVYVLDLANPAVKALFIKEHNFETVPVSYVSKNILLIKDYMKSVRATYTRSSGDSDSEPAEKRPLNCPYVDIVDRRQNRGQYSGVAWSFEDVNANAVEGGVYVVWQKLYFAFNGGEYQHEYSRNFWQSIWELAQKAGVELPKVHGIYPRSFESAWFKEAKDNGDWVSLESWVNDNIGCLPKDLIRKVNAYYDANTYHLNDEAIELLSPLVAEIGNTAGKYFAMANELIPNAGLRSIPEHLRLTEWVNDEEQKEAIVKMNEAMRQKYPLVYRLANNRHIDTDTAQEVADYINLVDANTPAPAPMPAA